ncbi:MAG: cobalamin-binding protein, partial [Candidatus Marinimicrobia bacterium]|nr:cobalamin-binding protein [Candidatus Neomarinimicrobiota bacterium]
MNYLEKLHDAVLNGNPTIAVEITEKALREKIDPHILINEYMIRAMDEVGVRFERFEYFIPQLLMSAKAMKSAMALIRPLLISEGEEDNSICAITGTVKGDVHDIGKNLLGALLEGGGFRVVDLGTNVSPEQFIEAV